MAHNLEIKKVNGVEVASFVENGKRERAWHNLGQVFDGAMTVEEALKLSHADYQVALQPVIAMTPALSEAMASNNADAICDAILDAQIAGRKATVRLDTQESLGVVSDYYGVVQNADAFKFVDTLCSGELGSDHVPVIETAGVLGHGERVFISAKFPEDVILDNKGDDRVEMYVVFTTSHDGTAAVNCMVTPVRVVCNNTLNFAMGHNFGKISLRHTSQINARLDLTNAENAEFAYRTLNMYDIYKKSMEERFLHLQSIKLAERDLDRILAEVLYSDKNKAIYKATGDAHHADISTFAKNQFDKVRGTIETGIGQEVGMKGTGMWLINGLTTFYQNEYDFKTEEQKFDSIMSGYASKKVQQAYELVTAA